MWCLRGVRAIAPSRRPYVNGYLYGALEVGGGGSEFLFTPALNKQWDRGFLEQIAAYDPEAIHVVIGDGTGFRHRKDEQELPEKIRIITLPAYSPAGTIHSPTIPNSTIRSGKRNTYRKFTPWSLSGAWHSYPTIAQTSALDNGCYIPT